MQSVKIKGSIKDYAWGNDYFIPSLLGIKKDGPSAEYWMGTHPSGCAETESGEMLSSYIAKDSKAALGEKYNALPLLFKILAIEKPLSLQCHPNKEQAKEGWKREGGEKINYQDDNEKAEIILALTPVTAMCGFRELDAIKKNFKEYIPLSYESVFSSDLKSIKDMFFTLYSLSDDEKEGILSEFKASLVNKDDERMNGPYLTLTGLSLECLEEYKGDIGALSPLFMNIVYLDKGEALFLKPDTVHAYVLGNGVELMSSSDNVLRAGLTKKRVDLDELKRIMEFDSLSVKKAEKVKDDGGRIHYKSGADCFELASLESGEYRIKDEASLIIVTEGKAKIGSLELEKGEVAFIPYSENSTLSVDGMVYQAIVI